MKKKKEEPKIEQPSNAQQRQLKAMIDDTPTMVSIIGQKKKYGIRWLKNGTISKLTRLLIHAQKSDNDEDGTDDNILNVIVEDSKLACKAAAAIILNGFWSIKFKYWFLWRWYYYVKQYSSIQLQPILEVGKKKIPLIQFFGTTTLLIGVKDTLMQMRTTEVERILQEQALEQYTTNASTGNTSSGQDTSSSAS